MLEQLTDDEVRETVTALIEAQGGERNPVSDFWEAQPIDPSMVFAIAMFLAQNEEAVATSLAGGMQVGWALCRRTMEKNNGAG